MHHSIELDLLYKTGYMRLLMHLEIGSKGPKYTRWSSFTISSVLQYFDQISDEEGASTQTLASDYSPFNSASNDGSSSVPKRARIEDTQGWTLTTDAISSIRLIEFQSILRHKNWSTGSVRTTIDRVRCALQNGICHVSTQCFDGTKKNQILYFWLHE